MAGQVRRIPYVPTDETNSPLVCCLQCCVIAFIILVILGFLYIVFWFSRFVTQADRQAVPIRNTTEHGKLFNFYETERLCNAYLRDLPHPQSQNEEDEMIAEILTKVEDDCEFVYFGFTADENVRYQSLSSDVTWPSLKMLPDGILPFDFEKCYELRFSQNEPPKVASTENCGNKTGRSLLFLTRNESKLCSRRRYKCVEIYNSLPLDNVTASFNTAKTRNSNLLFLVPFDKDYSPEILRWRRSLMTAPVIVMATRYRFIYKYRSFVQEYTSSRFSVVDPEYDCLAYDIKRDKVVTRDCEDNACPICADLTT